MTAERRRHVEASRPRASARAGLGFLAVCLWWALLVCCPGGAVLAQYRFDNWTAETGLPQNSVRAILQTRDGYLWVATLDGMARFDGVRFRIFDRSNTPGINSNRFIALYEARNGDLWMGTEDGGVTRLRQGKFTSYKMEHGLPHLNNPAVFGDDSGGVWVFSGSHLVQWADGKFTPGRIPGFEVPLVSGYSWDAHGVSIGPTRFAHGRLNTRAMPDGRPIYIFDEDQYGTEWGMVDGSVVKIREGKVVRVITASDGLPDKVMDGSALTRALVLEDRRGNIWLNRPGALMGRLTNGVFTTHSTHDASMPLLPGNEVKAFYEDSEGAVWIGTDRNGLYRVRPQAVTVYSIRQGLEANNIYPVLEDRSGAVWVGAWEKGLSRIKDGAITNYSTTDGLSDYPLVTALYEDGEGRLWIGHHGGLRIFQDGRIKTPGIAITEPVEAIHQDRAGAFWFGSMTGLYRYQNGNLARFTMTEGLADLGLTGDDIKAIIESRDGSLWIGAYGGLIRYEDGRFSAWTEAQGLSSNRVRALYEDRDGVLWIGSYDGGLCRFKDGRFTRYTTKNGLFNDGVFQILEDSRGNFWMSCNRGIYRVSKRELNEFAEGRRASITSVAYGRSDGMLNPECNGGRWPAGVKTRDGKLWFPTQDGVAVIDPEAIPFNAQPPPVVIESFLLDRAPVAPLSLERPVRIAPGWENFEIEYTALSFINSERIRFKYKLEGLDQDWTDAGTRRAAYYSYVPPGEYVFRVIAANSDGVWNDEGQSLRVIVAPPFYLTWWFLTLAAIGAAGLLWFAWRYRVAQYEREQAAQHVFSRRLIESQESERKRIAAELHDSLGQDLLVIKNRAALNAMESSDERSRLRFDELGAAVSHTLEEARAISHDLRPPHLDQLGLRTALVAMIEKVAASSTIKFTGKIDDPAGFLQPGDEITLYRIAQELLNNILKHSGATEARVALVVADGRISLTVSDNGRGFTLDGAGAGLGLQGIAERALILRGSHAIHSAPGQGTTVTVKIELKEK